MRREDNNKSSQSSRSVSYRKQVVEQNTSSKLKQGFLNATTNISYKIGGSFNKFTSFITSSSKQQHVIIYINGKKYANEEQAKNAIRKIIWFSYRRLPGLTKNLHCDTGWGCLIRVGQMALAAGLKLFMQTKFGDKPHIVHQTIIAFVQSGGKQQKYSLKKIVQRGHKMFNLNYGDWFNVTQICEVLVYLHKHDPMKNAQNLQLIHFKNAAIYLDQIFEKLEKKMCNCQKRRILCLECNQSIQKLQNKPIQSFSLTKSTAQLNYRQYRPSIDPNSNAFLYNSNPHYSKNNINNNNILHSQYTPKLSTTSLKNQKKLLLFVTCRPGVTEIGIKQYQQIIQLLELQCSLGMIGGIPRKGLYFIGHAGDQLIYLDPHYVQDQITLAKLHLLIRTFQTKQMRKVSRTSIDPSMAFVFYIDSLQTLKKLQSKIQDISDRFNNPVIVMDWVNQYKSEDRPVSIVEASDQQENQLDNSFIQEL